MISVSEMSLKYTGVLSLCTLRFCSESGTTAWQRGGRLLFYVVAASSVTA